MRARVAGEDQPTATLPLHRSPTPAARRPSARRTGRCMRAAFRAGGRQLAFRHWPHHPRQSNAAEIQGWFPNAVTAPSPEGATVGLREIRRVSRREISQAGRDALAWARFSFRARFNFLVHPTGSRKYGGGSCNPSVLRSYFAPAWRASADMVRQPGQEDTGGTRAAFRTGGRQLAFRHWPQLCEGPALLAHIFVGRHRPPASGRNASCGGLVRRDCRKLYQLTARL